MTGKAKIILKGKLDKKWNDWFDGMEVFHKGNDTVLTGYIKDESFIHGIFNKIRDLNIPLISVNPINENKSNK